MIDTIKHPIQKHIMNVLTNQRYARFRDLRPPRVDTNLYSYHLKVLQKDSFVDKISEGYTLSQKGLAYVDRVSVDSQKLRLQPKIITMLVVQNSEGDVLLMKRSKQPYIDTWALPHGKVDATDESVLAGAKREWSDKIGGRPTKITAAGSCYIRILSDGEVISSTLVHVFYALSDNVEAREDLQWMRPHKLSNYDLAPATEQIIARTFFRDPYFFEEYTECIN